MLALVVATAAPADPEILRFLQGDHRIDRPGNGKVRGPVGENEGNGLAGIDLEVSDRCQILTAGFDRGPQYRHVLTANREQCGRILRPLDPRNLGAEAEA